jgi:ribulose-phosphate 3-epimerase
MKLSASLFAADPLQLGAQLAAVEPHVDSFHVDIMDGRFAAAFGLEERLVRTLLRTSVKPIDLHLMIEDPVFWAPRFAGLGARIVAVHAQSDAHVGHVLRSIRKEGALAYVALRAETRISAVQRIIEDADGPLLVTAAAGGGNFVNAALEKAFDLPRAYPSIIDGHVEEAHFEVASTAGVDLAAIGRSLFDCKDLSARAGARLRKSLNSRRLSHAGGIPSRIREAPLESGNLLL